MSCLKRPFAASGQSVALWHNPYAFTTSGNGKRGNAGRNLLRAPGIWQMDTSVGVTKEKIEAEGKTCILIAGDVSEQKFCDVSKFGSDTPIKRPAQPEEITSAYVLRASPHCSSYITGEILPIIGGYSGG